VFSEAGPSVNREGSLWHAPGSGALSDVSLGGDENEWEWGYWELSSTEVSVADGGAKLWLTMSEKVCSGSGCNRASGGIGNWMTGPMTTRLK